MQVVIDISAMDYADIMQTSKERPRELTHYERLISKGTPLPEHHGDLKDYENIVDAIDDWYNACEHRRINAIDYLRKRINDAPTVLEGVKE